MLIYNSRLIGTPVLSVQTGAPIGYVSDTITDPDNLTIIAFRLNGPLIGKSPANLLAASSVREYSSFGMVVDSIDELITSSDVIKIERIIGLNFSLIGLKVETKKGNKLGKVSDFTVTSEDFITQQIIVKRPAIKSFIDPELTISRKEITEVTDYKIIVKDEEKTLKQKAATEDFIPNFVNPFRKTEQDFAPIESNKPAKPDHSAKS